MIPGQQQLVHSQCEAVGGQRQPSQQSHTHHSKSRRRHREPVHVTADDQSHMPSLPLTTQPGKSKRHTRHKVLLSEEEEDGQQAIIMHQSDQNSTYHQHGLDRHPHSQTGRTQKHGSKVAAGHREAALQLPAEVDTAASEEEAQMPVQPQLPVQALMTALQNMLKLGGQGLGVPQTASGGLNAQQPRPNAPGSSATLTGEENCNLHMPTWLYENSTGFYEDHGFK